MVWKTEWQQKNSQEMHLWSFMLWFAYLWGKQLFDPLQKTEIVLHSSLNTIYAAPQTGSGEDEYRKLMREGAKQRQDYWWSFLIEESNLSKKIPGVLYFQVWATWYNTETGTLQLLGAALCFLGEELLCFVIFYMFPLYLLRCLLSSL